MVKEQLRNCEIETSERNWKKESGLTRVKDQAIQPFRKSTVFSIKRQKLHQVPAASFDAIDPFEDEESRDQNQDSDSNEESDSDEDDTAAILAELRRIKKEQAVKQVKKEMKKRQEEKKICMGNIYSGNPLLNYSSQNGRVDMKILRRWDDAVFKNCARSELKKKHDVFINDSLQSEGHCKFMEKYVE
ncbi:PREDICTED: protein CWC15 homolog B-like [Atta colombica]|uniref:protein CWC15 homolog B-like n=1 Tax=Atta colombica TaxID=520822 RepID=UPI00084BD63F|nr:PREDICTED: protein CWC15 homolog B-like [Atta colombica]